MKKSLIFMLMLLSNIMLFAQSYPGAGTMFENSQSTRQVFTCPANSQFSQIPTEIGGFYTSDAKPCNNWITYDDFHGLNGFNGICFWGYNTDWNCDAQVWEACTNDDPMTFEIKFYQDNSGTVGAEVASFTAVLTREPTGFIPYPAYGELYQYCYNLPSPILLSDGWVSVQGTASSCQFGWDVTYGYNNYSYQYSPLYVYEEYHDIDQSLCLYTNDQVPVSNWALALGIGLIIVVSIIWYKRLS